MPMSSEYSTTLLVTIHSFATEYWCPFASCAAFVVVAVSVIASFPDSSNIKSSCVICFSFDSTEWMVTIDVSSS